MDPVTLDTGAEDNGLALMLQGLVVENIAAHPDKRRDFDAITTRFAVVASDADTRVSLWFDGGRCTLYDGIHDGSEVVVTASSDKIPQLSLLKIRYGLPWLFDEAGKGFVRDLVMREIKIDGLVALDPMKVVRRAHDLVRLTRVLSVA